jgi:hypothetical protein
LVAKEYLWAGQNCDLRYVGNDGNIAALTGQKGTFCCWVNTSWAGNDPGGTSPGIARLLWAQYDANNYLAIYASRAFSPRRFIFEQKGAGTTKTVYYEIDATSWPRDTWKHVAITWDFTGGTGAGILRLYVNGVERGTAVTNANPLAGAPATIQIGSAAGTATYGWKGFIDDVGIWNGVMTAQQALALYNAGRKHRLVEADGTGTMLFRCRYDGSYDADIAAGTATATYTTTTGSNYETAQVALIEDGSTERNVRQRFHFGYKVTSPVEEDVDRIPGHALWYKRGETFTVPLDEPGYTYWTTAGGTNNHLYLRGVVDWKRTPLIWKIRLWWSGLNGSEYFKLGPYPAYLRFYSNKITDDSDGTNRVIYVKSGYGWSDSIEWVDLWVICQPFGTGGNTYIVVNGSEMIPSTCTWSSATELVRIMCDSTTMPTSTVTIRIESIEVYGPTQYQLNDSPCDNFSFSEYAGQPSGKVWQISNLTRKTQKPVKYEGNPVLKPSDFPSFGDFLMYGYMEEKDENTLRFWLSCMNESWGTDSGVYQLRFFESTDGGRTWTQDPANPIMDLRTLSTHEGEWDWSPSHTPFVMPMIQDPDGNNVCPYVAQNGYDGYQIGLLVGMPDEYSLDASQKYARNPVVRTNGRGADGALLWYNRDVELYGIYENPYWQEGDDDRYTGFGRGKTQWWSYPFAQETREMLALKSPDLKVWKPMSDTPLAIPAYPYWHWGYWRRTAKDQFVALVECNTTDGLYLLESEDGILWHQTDTSLIALEPGTYPWENANPTSGPGVGEFIRHGDQWLCFYRAVRAGCSSSYGLATIRYDGFTYYELAEGQTSGWLETCAFEKPQGGWGAVTVNVDGLTATEQVTVEVRDGETDEPLAGYTAADCDPLTNGTAAPVTWRGVGLAGAPNATLRLRVALRRASAGATSPRLYAYAIAALKPPTVSDVRVEGLVDPGGVTDATPTFSWAYSDPQGLAQVAYRVMVASTQERLDGGDYDVWDSGEVAGAGTSVKYAGTTPLESNQVYHVRVQAKNLAGVWSE